jgi:hypothetical protein
MIFDVLRESEKELCFATAHKARRGRGILYALAPWLLYLFGISVAFAVSLRDPSAWEWIKRSARVGAYAAAALSAIAYALGYRARNQVTVTADAIHTQSTPSLGPSRITFLPIAELTALGIDACVRSLGADLLLVAVHRDGRRTAIAEGESHLGQLRQFASRAAQLTGLALEAPKFAPAIETHSNASLPSKS